MDISVLTNYFIPAIAGVCLCLGYVIKTATPIQNKYIPALNAAVGLGLAIWIHWGAITPDVVLSGMFSGLAATGLYEAFRHIVEGK